MNLICFGFVLICFAGCSAAARTKNMPAEKIKLYYLPPSPPCRAVMMTAKVIGLDLEYVLTNIMNGDHLTPEYLKMNPQHTIPTMDDNGFILSESRAIMSYLVNAYGKNDSLYPRNPRSRALVDARMHFDIGTLFNRYLNLYGPMMMSDAPFNDELGAKLTEALEWLEKMLEGHPFVAGDNMTIADISIVVTVSNMDALDFDMSQFENVKKWYDRTKKALMPYEYNEINQAGADMLASFIKKDK